MAILFYSSFLKQERKCSVIFFLFQIGFVTKVVNVAEVINVVILNKHY